MPDWIPEAVKRLTAIPEAVKRLTARAYLIHICAAHMHARMRARARTHTHTHVWQLSQRALVVHWDLTKYLIDGDIRWQFPSFAHLRAELGCVFYPYVCAVALPHWSPWGTAPWPIGFHSMCGGFEFVAS